MAMRVSEFARNERGVDPSVEGYGIEIEVEEYDPERWGPDGRALRAYWQIDRDGSLRNNGAEFVTRSSVPADSVEQAVRHLYARTGEHWRPSVRTGIHIHANMLGRTLEEISRIAAYYAFAEPVLFDFVGPTREENIYCVPWYRAPNEADVVMAGCKQYGMFNESCKYSSLYFGPLLTYGTIEFRHAPTYVDPNVLLDWWKLCRCVAQSYLLPDPVLVYANGGTKEVLRTLFGGRYMDEEYEGLTRTVEDVGAHEVALRFQPYTYKLGQWGKPGEFSLTRKREVQVAQPQVGLDELLRQADHERVVNALRMRPIRGGVWAEEAPEVEEPEPIDEDEQEEEF